jgi:hypothetical protein
VDGCAIYSFVVVEKTTWRLIDHYVTYAWSTTFTVSTPSPKFVLLIVPFATSLFILMSSRLFYPKFSNVFIKCLEIFVACLSKMGWGIKVKWLVLTHLIAPSQCPLKGTKDFFSSPRRCVLYRSKLWVSKGNAMSTSFEVDPLGSYLWFYHLKVLGLFNLLL